MENSEKHPTGISDGAAAKPGAVILRLEGLRATPRNVDRMRERVQLLNRQLAAAGVPFRVRLL